MIEDNEYAISVPVEVQDRRRQRRSRLLTGFPDLKIVECDGTDLLESHRARARGGAVVPGAARGPALLHAHTTRPLFALRLR